MVSRWRSIRKIDAHVHVVLHERRDTDLALNTVPMMIETMDAHRIERAVVLPINYAEYFPLDGEERLDWLAANNARQAALASGSDGRLIPFADCALEGRYGLPERVRGELKRAVNELGLRGLKIHASNLKASADDPRLGPVVEAAGQLGIPIMFHSNPTAQDPDFYGSSPARIYRQMYGRSQPFVIAHLGGINYLELLDGPGYVDIAGALLQLAELYGVRFCERLLRRIGLERVLFGTDYPVFSYDRYFELLDAMSFTDREIEQIAYNNAAQLLNLE